MDYYVKILSLKFQYQKNVNIYKEATVAYTIIK